MQGRLKEVEGLLAAAAAGRADAEALSDACAWHEKTSDRQRNGKSATKWEIHQMGNQRSGKSGATFDWYRWYSMTLSIIPYFPPPMDSSDVASNFTNLMRIFPKIRSTVGSFCSVRERCRKIQMKES